LIFCYGAFTRGAMPQPTERGPCDRTNVCGQFSLPAGNAPLDDPCEPLRECLCIGWEFSVQDPRLIQEQVGGVLAKCLFGISEICKGDNEVMARIDLKDWLCCGP